MFRSLINWRLKTPFYYGWLVLAISAVATFAASGLTQVVLGGVQVYITDESGWMAAAWLSQLHWVPGCPA